MDKTYEIINGVRRSKAAQMAGHHTILARLYTRGAAQLLREFEIPIASLRSPHKSSIRQVSQGEQLRWQHVMDGANQRPLPFPPIEVVEGSRCVQVEDISFDCGEDL